MTQHIRSFGGTAVAAGLWARFCRCGRAGDGGVQSDGYINGPAAVYCGNTEGYLCGPQQHDSTRQRRTRHAHTETEQTHIIHGSGSQVPVLEYSRSISQLYPDIRIEGENYPPKPINKYLGNFISYFKLLAIALIVTGQNPFQMFGMDTPRIWSWGQENKIFSCLMAFFLSNMLETHFLSTGAFEVTLNGVRSRFSVQRDCGLWHNEGLR
ncbi:hypothetical protein PO909_006598 [Leuciscus waleckii]